MPVFAAVVALGLARSCLCGIHLAVVPAEIRAGTASSEKVARAAERELELDVLESG